jgi:hypothetical protein
MENKDKVSYKHSIETINDNSVIKVNVDLSQYAEDEEEGRLEKLVVEFLNFLSKMGFTREMIVEHISLLAKKIEEHPDNTDFSISAGIEEKVNNKEDLEGFIDYLHKDEMEIYKEVYRRWLYMEALTKSKDDSQD